MFDSIQNEVLLHPHLLAILIVFVIGYFIFQAIVGSMPPLPDSATYNQIWVYGALHALALNWKYGVRLLRIPLPPDAVATEPANQKH